jgi:alcohol dehydrogenase
MSMSTSVRAAVLERPGEIVIHTLPRPEVGLDEALLKVDLAGVCGTDVKYFTGGLGLGGPTVLGHEIFGTLEVVGPVAAERYGVKAGDRVLVEGAIPCWACGPCRSGDYRFCRRKREYGSKVPVSTAPGLWGAMAEYMFITPGSILHRVPDALSPEAAIAAALVANGFEWLQVRGGVTAGDRIVIQGAGPQAIAATAVAAEMGVRQIIVTGLGRDGARLELAKAMGAHHALIADEEDVVQRVGRLTGDELADAVLDVTGSTSALATSVEMVRPNGTVVLAGLAGRSALATLAPDHLVWNQIRLQGAYVKGDAAFARAIQFMEDRGDAYPFDRLVSHVFPLEEAAEAIMAVTGQELAGFVKAAIRP